MRRALRRWPGIALMSLCWAGVAQAAPLVLVENGAARCAIVAEDDTAEWLRRAVHEFRYHVQKATGAAVPVLAPAQADRVPPGHVRILIGPGALTPEQRQRAAELPPERFRYFIQEGALVFLGHDVGQSFATMWAVDDFVDRTLGVRWLWPGEEGTYVPRHTSMRVPEDLDIQGGPRLEERRLRTSRPDEEVTTWILRHRMGSRMTYRFGHSFGHWWAKYHETHPDYFAVPPPAYTQPWPRAEWVKLNVGNPAVVDQIVAEWTEAGRPDNWNVCPNDGSGWCTGPASRALDDPALQSVSAEDIWLNRANLTPRFVRFWNRILVRMKALNPNVTISTYAYSAYREPPTGLTLEPGMIIGWVHSYLARENWLAWHATGAKLILRPNWWHMGAVAPHMPLHQAGDFFKFVYENSMIGFDFDSLMGYFGTQGPYYYLIARLSVRPEMSVDDVLEEYAQAFGPAARAIRDYIDFWERFTVEAAYTIPVGGWESQNVDGPYETAARRGNFSLSPLSGGWRVLPDLVPEQVCGQARAILARGQRAAAGDSLALRRIQFLEDGLRHVELTRDVIHLAYQDSITQAATREEFIRKVKALHAFRRDITKRHVIWADAVERVMTQRGIKSTPADFKLSDVEGEGQ